MTDTGGVRAKESRGSPPSETADSPPTSLAPLAVRRAAALLAIVSLAISLLGLESGRPLEAHEVFVARSATEMARRGDWIVPYFNAEPRLEKPPMSYWLAAAAHRLLGNGGEDPIRDAAARLPSAVAGALLVLVTVALAATVTGSSRVAVASGALLLTATGFSAYAANARPEMAYALFCGIGVLGFARAARAVEAGRPALRAALAGWLGFALATLSKGPLLPAFLLLGIVTGLAVSRPRPSLSRSLRPLAGLALFLLVAGSWYAVVSIRLPMALDFWRGEMFDRTGGVAAAWWSPLEMYYVGTTAVLFLPWAPLIPFALVDPWLGDRRRRALPTMLWFSVAAPMFFLGFSRGRHAYYMLPALAPLAVLAASSAVRRLDRLAEAAAGRKRARALAALSAALLAIGATVVVILVFRAPAGHAVPPLARAGSVGLAALAVGFALRAWRSGAESLSRSATSTLAGVALLGAAVSWSGVGGSRDRYSEGEFAARVGRVVPRDVGIVATGEPPALVVHYADRVVPRIRYEELPGRLAAAPRTLVLDRRSRVERGRLRGEIVLEENGSVDKDGPLVLVRPAPISAAPRGER